MQFLPSLLPLLLTGASFVLGQCPAGGTAMLNGYRCTSSTQCQNISPEYYCYQGVCCLDSLANSVSYGGYCTMTAQCSTFGAMCISHVCQCANGSQYNGRACIATPILCPSNQISINGQCYRRVTYGFLCNYTQQCAYIGAFCTDGICRCQFGFTFDGSKCIPRSKICPGNQIAISGQCYPFARLGEACMYSEQCIDKWYRSLLCVNGQCVIQMNDDTSRATCRDRRAEVEYVNGSVKNCLYWPCTVGYFCEYSESQNGGQYICCGTNANNIYGKVKVYPGTNKPLNCSTTNGCIFPDTPNCVMSHRYGYKVCCSTMNC
ncbi:EB module family protein [Brugia malayi]|uniref:Bm11069 n=1 Tax=Brugia malayi TaxID=6279 RepID=A0A0H5SCN3_BRUMA|nr:EB module family protein [Brugia malayi]CRZ26101.1 Bm11069 [Brugia malayi]VIO99303.1 EB module family protein [Brugia malayi]